MNNRALWTGVMAVTCVMVLAACSERPQVVSYKQGSYQGKPDTPPYANAPFNGDQKTWDNAMNTRNQVQNEYKRTRD